MKTIVVCCVVLVAAAGWAAGSAQPAAASTQLTAPEKAVLALINTARTSRGLHELRVVPSLERASRSHSRDMLKRDYFSHCSFSGASYPRGCCRSATRARATRAGRSVRSSAGAAAARPRRVASFVSG